MGAVVLVVVESEQQLCEVGRRMVVLDAGDNLEEEGCLPPEGLCQGRRRRRRRRGAL